MSAAALRRGHGRRRRLRRLGWNVVGIAVFVVMVFPVYWMIATAFKPADEINSLSPTWFSAHPTVGHFRDAIDRPFFWEGVRNSLIVVSITVALSMVLAFFAAVALAKYRFSGRKLFIVLMIGIQMLPQTGLIIPLYVVLARYHQVNALSGVIVTYMTFVLPFTVWTLRGFLIGIPRELEEAAMVDGNTPARRVRADPAAARRARARGDLRLRLHHELERVHLRPDPAQRPGQADDHGLALLLPRHEPAHRLGRADGGLGADRGAGRDLLRARAAQDRLRADGRRGQGVSLRALAAGCLLASFPGDVPPDWLRRRLADGLGGVCLFAWNVGDVAGLTAALAAERRELVVAVDEEGGDVTRLEWERGSSFPGNLALGTVDDVELTERVAAAIAGALARAGANLNLAPVADANTNPRNPVIGVRSFGAGPALVARHTAAFVRGTQKQGVAACAKHFPGHGDTAQDSHLELPAGEPCLEPFRAAIDAGVGAVMTAHLRVPSLDEAPATLSRRIVTELLREELGFDGVVVSDALDMRAISARHGVGEAAVLALAAGVDALCLGSGFGDEGVGAIVDAVEAAVRDGRLVEERLAEAAGRVEALADWADPTDEGAPGAEVGLEAARRAVRGRARAGTVVELAPPANIAAGDRPLADIRVREGDPLPDVAGPVVLLLRDAARHPWQQRVAAAFPEAILVETGMPAGAPT